MLVSEGDEGVSGDEEFVLEVAEEVEVVELSLNSVAGLSEPRTMKLKGEIHGKEVVVFIDCGATHNFIFKSVVESLQIPRQGTLSGNWLREAYKGNGCLQGSGFATAGHHHH